jgi:hypothetical protein
MKFRPPGRKAFTNCQSDLEEVLVCKGAMASLQKQGRRGFCFCVEKMQEPKVLHESRQ